MLPLFTVKSKSVYKNINKSGTPSLIFKISKASKFSHFCYFCLCRITYVVSPCCHGQLTFLQFQFRSFSNKWANFIRCLAKSTCQFDRNAFRDMKLKYTYLRIVVHNNSKLILKDFFKLGSAEITYPAQLHLGQNGQIIR